MIKFYFGTVISIDERYVIEFDILGLDSFDTKPTAYVLGEITNEVKEGDTVMIINVASPMASYFYIPLRVSADTSWKNKLGIFNKEVHIDITDDQKILFALNDFTLETKGDGNGLVMNIGDIAIEANSTGTGATVKINETFSIEATPSDATLKIGSLEIKGLPGTSTIGGTGLVTMNGMVTPNPTGPFNCLPVCPMTGAVHAGNSVTLM